MRKPIKEKSATDTIRERMLKAKVAQANRKSFWSHSDFENGESLIFPLDGEFKTESRGKPGKKYEYTTYYPSSTYRFDAAYKIMEKKSKCGAPSCTVINREIERAIEEGHTWFCCAHHTKVENPPKADYHSYACESHGDGETYLSAMVAG